MDRYLCKARAIDSPYESDWVEGHLLKLGETYYINPVANTSTVKGHLLTGRLVVHEIDPSTLCQCTGLKDKNGKLIFEGDIITWETWDDYYEPWFMVEGHVYYHEHSMEYRVKGYDGCSNSLKNIMKEKLEIVGNIHDESEVANATNNNKM